MVMRRSGLSAAQQAFALHARFPDAKGTVKAGRLVWIGLLQPTPLSRSYRVEITFRAGQSPRVRILESLETREGRSLPHVYSDGTLCLHEPGDWADRMFIADSTVPWTAEWLANYEMWLATEDWHGGGEWPPRRGDSLKSGQVTKDPSEKAG
jgi:hypothetical protein